MNAMKRPLAQTFGFFLGALLLSAGLYWISEKVAPVYAKYKIRMQKLQEHAETIAAINLGNSHNRAIDYHYMDLRGFHLWKGGSDLFGVCYTLRAIAPMLPNLKVVLINVNPLSFRHDDGATDIRGGIRREYYAITPTIRSWQPMPGDIKNLVQGKLAPLVREDHWLGVFDSLAIKCGGIKLSDNRRTAREKKAKARGKATIDKGERDAVYVDEDGYFSPYIEVRLKPDSLTSRYDDLKSLIQASESVLRRNPALPDEIYDELVATVKRLKARNIRVIFYTSPYLETVNQLFAKRAMTQLSEMREYMRRLTKEHGAEYYDFSHDAEFTQRPDYFFSEDHLNKFGAAVFSRKLNEICGFDRLAKL